ncbi:helix-turn-helix transcriptional regulator [Pseudogracilibacillus sp. SE30717A]|uniref:helix-turn-helix domain-containing protein n=1 Tax=Pseudogracilibacillus sp. SE30717A TaxID=3098293 RepID=UPI00300E3F91
MDLLGERLKDLRDEFGYDQKEMGKKLNITTSAYGYYEQGRNEPPLETLIKIAGIFKVSTDYLLGLSDQRKNPVYYSLSKKISLSDAELMAVQHMKEISLLQELSEDPQNNVARLNRYWQFIVHEHNQDY